MFDVASDEATEGSRCDGELANMTGVASSH